MLLNQFLFSRFDLDFEDENESVISLSGFKTSIEHAIRDFKLDQADTSLSTETLNDSPLIEKEIKMYILQVEDTEKNNTILKMEYK